MEAKSFINKDDFDLTLLDNRINYWEVESKDYDFEQITPQSRLRLFFRLYGSDIVGDLKVSRENCAHLMSILREYIIPNLVE